MTGITKAANSQAEHYNKVDAGMSAAGVLAGMDWSKGGSNPFITKEGGAATFVYGDATKGWQLKSTNT